ncbi:MAG: hypothetical protein JWP57_3261 [Spirosoma sp.]|nr:hypothetical protein [Spirosoma sp.]
MRLYRVGTYSVFFDEKTTLLVSQGVVVEGYNQKDVFNKPYFTPADYWRPKTIGDYSEAVARSDIGNSPVYYAILHGWMSVFGLSDWSLRMPSVLFSTLTVLLLFIFVRRHFRSDTLALVSAAIAAVEPFFVAYSHMARNYSTTFFFTLLVTHVFLLILEKASDREVPNRRVPIGLYIAYSLLFILSVLSHYLTITVFLCHGLCALLYLRSDRAWITLGLAAMGGLGLLSLWFIYGGGRYTFFVLNSQAEFYRHIALTNPLGSEFGIVLPATIPNIAKKAAPIFADLFIITNGLGSALLGLRNLSVALVLGGAATLIMHRYWNVAKPPVWVYGAVSLLLLAGLPFYSVVPLRFFVLSAAFPFFYLMARYIIDRTDDQQKRLVICLLILTFIPTLFLLFMAWRSGHTFGITQRYSGFSFPYVCILIAMGLRQLVRLQWWFSVPMLAALLVQSGFIIQLLGKIYDDIEPKYTYFSQARISNPYWSSAQELMKRYVPGDTIVYPNRQRQIYDEKIESNTFPASVFDAQLTNVYLPKDAQYMQRIDPAERDRLILIKGRTGEKITIFDFEGTKYRY